METTSKSSHLNIAPFVLYRRAMDIYDELMKRENYDPQLHLFKAACLYAFTQYKESKVEAEKCHEDTPLKNRLLFQLA